jgi:alpha-tubulin suppressor-like RCC1 family protein
MPTFYNYGENGVVYSFDDVFVPKNAFMQGQSLNWGYNANGALGVNNTRNWSQPVSAFATDDWKQMAANSNHTAVISTNGTLWTWGDSSSGQLGNNSLVTRSNAVQIFTGGTNWKQVSCGRLHTSAIKTDGTLWTWGQNSYGNLGDNTTTQRNTPVTTFAGGTNWKQVSCGNGSSSAIKTDGTLWTWGYNVKSALGDNTTTNRSTPVTTFAGGTNWKQVSSSVGNSTFVSSAVKTDGTLWTWGFNDYGQLGILQSFTPTVYTPVTTFAGGTNWAIIANGDSVQSLDYNAFNGKVATKTDGTLWTWGGGLYGSNGDNTLTDKPTPVTTFAGGTNWKQVDTAHSNQGSRVLAIKTDGTLWTWGRNYNAELGNNTISNRICTPVTTFAGGTDWKQVTSGADQSAAIKTDGTLWTWGSILYGQLGTNRQASAVYMRTPVTTFAGGTDWKQVSSGAIHTAAIKTDGTLWTWGYNGNAQLGNNTTTNRCTPVTTFAGGTNWKQVSCGNGSSSAIKTDGTLWTWGTNFAGQLGNNSTIQRNTPVTTFAGGTNWKQVSLGESTVTAIKTDGTLWTWGINTDGQLGDNTIISRSTPVTTFAGGTDWQAVSCHLSKSQTTAIKSDGTLWTWGSNYTADIGINQLVLYGVNTPVTTFAGGTNWKQVANGSIFTSAIKTDGTLWTWGDSSSGNLGGNTTTQRKTPVTTFAGGTNWKQVSCGHYHQAAIKTDGTLWVWGDNFQGQLGDFTVISRSTPVTTISGGNLWKQVSCGGFHTAAIEASVIYI